MTERKPPGMRFETWIDRQIREAQERGEFDNLPGKGKPIAGLDEPYDELWWVKQMLRREGVSVTPPSLALRREVEEALAKVEAANSETEVREIVARINERIVDANRKASAGPPSHLMPLHADRVVGTWLERRP